MYPVIRLIKNLWLASKKPKISYLDTSSITFRCRPWDLDMFNEMNNGRVLTLYDIGRFDLSVRCNLHSALKRNRWAIVVAGSSVRYRKRIHLFDKITMYSRCVGFDQRWIYIEQSMWVNGEPCSSLLLRGGVTSKNGLVPPDKVIEQMGESVTPVELPMWVNEWIDSEQHRPWPPLDKKN